MRKFRHLKIYNNRPIYRSAAPHMLTFFDVKKNCRSNLEMSKIA